MAEIRPLHAVRYEPSAVGSLDAVAAPPYDVIDAEMRAKLVGKSPFNVVEIDLPRGGRRRRSLPPRADDLRALASAGHPRPRARGLDLGAHPVLRGPGRERVHAPRLLRARARRGLRPGADPPARAHASRPEGGPPQPHPRDAREPVADLQPLPRPGGRGVEGARAAHERASLSTRCATTTAPRTASGASPTRRRSRRVRSIARRQGAADRRRPPPLRDRARLRARRSAARASTSGC